MGYNIRRLSCVSCGWQMVSDSSRTMVICDQCGDEKFNLVNSVITTGWRREEEDRRRRMRQLQRFKEMQRR